MNGKSGVASKHLTFYAVHPAGSPHWDFTADLRNLSIFFLVPAPLERLSSGSPRKSKFLSIINDFLK